MYNTQTPVGNFDRQRALVLPEPERRLNWWLRLTSMTSPPNDMSFATHERIRRSRLMSWLMLGILVVDILVIPISIGSVGTYAAIGAVFIGLFIVGIANRMGAVTFGGIFLVVLITAAVFGSIVSEPLGLSMFDIPGYDLLTITVVVGASILPPISGFFIAAANAALIVADFQLQPHAADLNTNIQLYGSAALVARSIALLIIVAIVGYLWVRGTHREILRANRAEEVAGLEHAFAVQRQQLEIGVQQILATHVRIANGDYNARAPLSQDNALWQIASSLNNLVSRFRTIAEQTNRVGYQLQRTEEEIHRLVLALRDLQAGRRPIWPAPSRTAVDELLPILSGRDRNQQTVQSPPSWDGGAGGGQTSPGGSQAQRFAESAYGRPSSAGPGAPTPPPFSGGGWAHNPPRFGPPLPDASRQPPSFPRPDSTGGSSGQMPPTPQSTPRSFEEAWPSLDGGATGGSDWGTGELNAPRQGEDPFASLDNPWYLPPDE